MRSLRCLVGLSAALAEIRFVTFLDCDSLNRMTLPLRNKACYARKHGYRYDLKLVRKQAAATETQGITYRKPEVILEAMARAAPDDLVVWIDADVVVMDSPRRFETLVDREAVDVWIADHNCNPNNGVIVLRNNAFGRKFVEGWIEICGLGQFPYTDQGCFYEQALRVASAGNTSLINECDLLGRGVDVSDCEDLVGASGRTDVEACYAHMASTTSGTPEEKCQQFFSYNTTLMDRCNFLMRQKANVGTAAMSSCVIREWDRVFGPFNHGARDRVAGRVGLRRAVDSFNAHYCSPQHHLKRFCRWAPQGSWAPEVCFRDGTFALHGRQPKRAQAIGMARASFNKAALSDGSLQKCIRHDAATDQTKRGACQSENGTWVALAGN